MVWTERQQCLGCGSNGEGWQLDWHWTVTGLPANKRAGRMQAQSFIKKVIWCLFSPVGTIKASGQDPSLQAQEWLSSPGKLCLEAACSNSSKF